MLSEKIKSIIIEDINDSKNIEDIKYALTRLVNSLPTNESVALNLAKAIHNGIELR